MSWWRSTYCTICTCNNTTFSKFWKMWAQWTKRNTNDLYVTIFVIVNEAGRQIREDKRIQSDGISISTNLNPESPIKSDPNPKSGQSVLWLTSRSQEWRAANQQRRYMWVGHWCDTPTKWKPWTDRHPIQNHQRRWLSDFYRIRNGSVIRIRTVNAYYSTFLL